MHESPCKIKLIGLGWGQCQLCRTFFDRNAVKEHLKRKFGESWEQELKNLRSERITECNKIRKLEL